MQPDGTLRLKTTSAFNKLLTLLIQFVAMLW
jgi:hypothetical protein